VYDSGTVNSIALCHFLYWFVGSILGDWTGLDAELEAGIGMSVSNWTGWWLEEDYAETDANCPTSGELRWLET